MDGEDLLTALNLIKTMAKNMPCRVIICGSLHLARDVIFVNNQLTK